MTTKTIPIIFMAQGRLMFLKRITITLTAIITDFSNFQGIKTSLKITRLNFDLFSFIGEL